MNQNRQQWLHFIPIGVLGLGWFNIILHAYEWPVKPPKQPFAAVQNLVINNSTDP